METIYIDVYFLINFCVDILALSLAAYFLKIKTGIVPLIIAGALGGAYAVIGIFLVNNKILMLPLSLLIFALIILIVTRGVGWGRKFKYSIAFFVAQILIGGMVYYSYCLLDRVFSEFEQTVVGEENRKFLIWSLIVLLSFGILKIILRAFQSIRSTRTLKLSVGFCGRKAQFEALVDSGNLAFDPRDGNPVILINQRLARRILGTAFDFFAEMNVQNSDIAKRMRIIPVRFGSEKSLLYGFTADYVNVMKNNKCENINVTLAIDQKGEEYGGYPALLPLSAIENVF